MKYKTIVLELLKQHTKIYRQLKSRGTLMPTLELYSADLKTRHEFWKSRLAQARPGSSPAQISSEALEIALRSLKDFLASLAPSSVD